MNINSHYQSLTLEPFSRLRLTAGFAETDGSPMPFPSLAEQTFWYECRIPYLEEEIVAISGIPWISSSTNRSNRSSKHLNPTYLPTYTKLSAPKRLTTSLGVFPVPYYCHFKCLLTVFAACSSNTHTHTHTHSNSHHLLATYHTHQTFDVQGIYNLRQNNSGFGKTAITKTKSKKIITLF